MGVRSPRIQVISVDEPLSNADAKLLVHMRAESRLQAGGDDDDICLPHDQIESQTNADRIVVLRMDGSNRSAPRATLSTGSNIFVARLYSPRRPMNLYQRSHPRATTALLSDAMMEYDLPLLRSPSVAISARLIRIRPEHSTWRRTLTPGDRVRIHWALNPGIFGKCGEQNHRRLRDRVEEQPDRRVHNAPSGPGSPSSSIRDCVSDYAPAFRESLFALQYHHHFQREE